ncbi:MAG: DUF4167 domain-containing protein [Holosporales bacterium]
MNMKRHRMRGHGGHGNGNGTGGGNNRYGGGGQRFNQPRNNFGGNNLENDRRIRANAVKMIEKYQNMAKDAQMNGDIILAENYFQYADHYQRVSNAHAPRFPESTGIEGGANNGAQQPSDAGFDAGDDEDTAQPSGDAPAADSAPRPQPQHQQPQQPRRERFEHQRRERFENQPRPPEQREPREPREVREPRENREPREYREPREPRVYQPRPEPRSEPRPAEPRPEEAILDIPFLTSSPLAHVRRDETADNEPPIPAPFIQDDIILSDDPMGGPIVRRRGRPKKVHTDGLAED